MTAPYISRKARHRNRSISIELDATREREVQLGERAKFPLQGIKVVEAGSWISGPFASTMLAHLGATVVKIEPPKGEAGRRFGLRQGGVSALWVNVNHGKETVELDLKSDAGRNSLIEILENADVFVHNWRPTVSERLRLGANDIRARFPSLIYLAISGFGTSGPKSNEPVFDTLLQGASGFVMAEAGDGPPRNLRSYIADKISATFAAQAVLAALFARESTGTGTAIDLSMLDVMSYFDFPDLCQDRTFLSPAARVDLKKMRSSVLHTLDGFIVLAPVRRRQFIAATQAVGHPEWMMELDQLSVTEFAGGFFDRIEPLLRTDSTGEWLRKFQEFDVPATQLLTMDEHFRDDQTLHNQIYEEYVTSIGPIRRVRYPARFDGMILPAVPVASPIRVSDQPEI